MKLYYKYILILLTIVTLSGCAALKEAGRRTAAIAQCSIELDDVNKYVSFTEPTKNLFNYVVDINFIGKNPTQYDISLGRYRFDLYANNKYLSSFDTQTSIKLKANANTPIQAKILIAPSSAIGILFKKLFNKPIEYKLNGTFYLSIGSFTLPIERTLLKVVDN